MNTSDRTEVLSIKFDDPDLDLLGGQGFSEFKLVTDSSEF